MASYLAIACGELDNSYRACSSFVLHFKPDYLNIMNSSI